MVIKSDKTALDLAVLSRQLYDKSTKIVAPYLKHVVLIYNYQWPEIRFTLYYLMMLREAETKQHASLYHNVTIVTYDIIMNAGARNLEGKFSEQMQ